MITAIRYSAPWCQPCKIAAPIFRQFAEEVNLPFIEVDIEASPENAASLGIQTIPTVIFLKDHEEVARLVGPKTSAQLKDAYETL